MYFEGVVLFHTLLFAAWMRELIWYICIQIQRIQLLIFTEKFAPLPGFEPKPPQYQANMLPIELSWLGYGPPKSGMSGITFHCSLGLIVKCRVPLVPSCILPNCRIWCLTPGLMLHDLSGDTYIGLKIIFSILIYIPFV